MNLGSGGLVLPDANRRTSTRKTLRRSHATFVVVSLRWVGMLSVRVPLISTDGEHMSVSYHRSSYNCVEP